MRYTALILYLLLSISGCGLKGPLYLPESEPETAQAQKPTDKPAKTLEQEKMAEPAANAADTDE